MEVAPPCEFATNARGAPPPLEPLDSSQILIHIEGRHMVVNLQLIGNAAPWQYLRNMLLIQTDDSCIFSVFKVSITLKIYTFFKFFLDFRDFQNFQDS